MLFAAVPVTAGAGLAVWRAEVVLVTLPVEVVALSLTVAEVEFVALPDAGRAVLVAVDGRLVELLAVPVEGLVEVEVVVDGRLLVLVAGLAAEVVEELAGRVVVAEEVEGRAVVVAAGRAVLEDVVEGRTVVLVAGRAVLVVAGRAVVDCCAF